jgi:hypothetical protein
MDIPCRDQAEREAKYAGRCAFFSLGRDEKQRFDPKLSPWTVGDCNGSL